MTNFNLLFFSELTAAPLQRRYSTETDFLGRRIKLDVNFDRGTITEDVVQTLQTFLERLEAFHVQNIASIQKDFQDGGETADYIQFYIDEFDESELGPIILGDLLTSMEQQLLNKLCLTRVGLYPDLESYFGVFGYSIEIDGEPCNQFLVITTASNGNLDHITWES